MKYWIAFMIVCAGFAIYAICNTIYSLGYLGCALGVPLK